MVANLIDGQNEYLSISRIIPVYAGKRHQHPDYWFLEGELYGKVMSLKVITEDRRKFLEAGYIPAQLFTFKETAVNITVLTDHDDAHGWRVGEVLPAIETVHTEAERQAAWVADCALFGGRFTMLAGNTGARFERIGQVIEWGKDAAGRYTRTENGVVTVYVGKGQS